jgi:myxalamid-type polyketide synthase MxaB
VGLATRLNELERAQWADRGVASIPTAAGMDIMGRLLGDAAAQVAVLPVDWEVFTRSLAARGPRLFLESLTGAREDSTSVEGGIIDELESASPPVRRARLVDHVRRQIAKVLALDAPGDIKVRQRLFDLGLDSLMALQVRNRLAESLGRALRATLLFDYPTVEALVEHLARDVLSLEIDDVARRAQASPDDAGLEGLSEEQLADLLSQELSPGREGRQE